MLEYLQRLEELKAIIAQHFQVYLSNYPLFSAEKQNLDFTKFKEEIDVWGTTSSELGSDLEISFRSIFQEYCIFYSATDIIEESNAVKFVKFVLDFSLQYPNISNASGKIPFLLIEDLLEYQTIHHSKKIWTIIESLVEKLTNPSLFPKGKFVVLKTCNALLKKLSKSYDTEFCGRILMFLAAVYPISERSALNISGKVNTNNVTYYEDREHYDANNPNDNGIKNSSAKPGEEGEEVDLSTLPFIITYDSYESFWKLQTYFASELKSFDTTTTLWTQFMENARKVFELLTRSVSLDPNSKGGKQQTGDHSTTSDETEPDYFGCKYLTSSQLFSLQLKDPLLRRQIAVQFLFLSHYLRVKAIPSVENEIQRGKYEKDLKFIHDRAKSLIETSGGSAASNKEFLEMIQRILIREERWIKWKNAGCQPFERIPIYSKETETGNSLKRKFDEMSETAVPAEMEMEVSAPAPPPAVVMKSIYSLALAETEQKANGYVFNTSREFVTEIAKGLAASFPDFEAQIQEYLDADDPDQGIEAEYHPKNSHLYCWRTRRLFAEKHLSYFKYMQDGNLGRGIRKLKNLPEPEPEPVIAEEMEDNNDTGSYSVKVVEDNAMLIEEDVDIEGKEEEGEDVAKTEGKIGQTPTPTGSVKSAFAEPEDGEEIEDSNNNDNNAATIIDDTKMEE